jgi:hypothetical protein
MLPGFRFLFAAIVLSMSILIFGLGAAALLRAAHEEFANLPARRTAPEPMFARRTDESPPTLALLRIDTPDDDKPAESVAETSPDGSATAAQAADTAAIEPEKPAAVKAPEPMQAEAAKPDTPAAEATVETPAAPPPAAVVEAPVPPKAPAAEAEHAALAETPQPAVAPPPPAPPADIYSFEGNPAATQIATLGGPAVIVDAEAAAKAAEKTEAKTTEAKTPEIKATEAKTAEAKPDRSAEKKRIAERAQERRRIAARRARLAREAALAQQQANPFIQTPFAQGPVTRATR